MLSDLRTCQGCGPRYLNLDAGLLGWYLHREDDLPDTFALSQRRPDSHTHSVKNIHNDSFPRLLQSP